MDIGAFMQSFVGDPMKPVGSGITGKENINSCWQPSEDLAANQEQTSFFQVVQKILGQSENAQGVSDETGEAAHEPSNGVSRMFLLLEMLGQNDIRELQPMANPLEHDADADGAIADLLALINAQLDGMEFRGDDIPAADATNKTNLLGLLNEKMAALETSLASSGKAISDDTLNDLQKTRSLLKSAIGQDINQVQQQSTLVETGTDVNMPMGQGNGTPEFRMAGDASSSGVPTGTISNDTASSDRLTTTISNDATSNGKKDGNLNDQTARMVNDLAVDDSGHTNSGAAASKAQATPVVNGRESASIDILQAAGSDSSVQVKSDPSDGKINRSTSSVQVLMPQREDMQSQQDSNQSLGDHNADRPNPMDWNGLKTKPEEGTSTANDQYQTAKSLHELDERLFANEKQSLHSAQQRQGVGNEPAKSAAADVFKNDMLADDSMKVAVSTDTTTDNRAQTSVSGKSTSMPTSGDTAFQKTVMNQIVEKVTFRSLNDRSEMRIQLKPDTLGDVRMSIVSEKNQLVVHMIADKMETKEIIESQLHHLKAELDKQGLTVGKIEVMLSADNDQQDGRGQFSQMFKNNADGGGKRQNSARQESAPQQHQQPDKKETDSSGDGINYFI